MFSVRTYNLLTMLRAITRNQLILIVLVGLFMVGTAGVMAQTEAQSEEEPNDHTENANPIEVGETVTGDLHADDPDSYNFTLQDTQAVNVTVSVSEEMTRYAAVSLVKPSKASFTKPIDPVHPGESETYTISKEEHPAFLQEVSGRYSLRVLPTDPSAPTVPEEQLKADGSYTITIESIDAADDSSTDTSTPPETSTELPNTLSIQSTGDERVYYDATTNNSIEPGPGADLTGASQPDEVSGSTASGSTAQGGVDNFTFRGQITALNLTGGPAEVSINGEQVDPDDYQTSQTPTPTSTPTPSPTPTETMTPTSTPTPSPTPVSTSTATAAPILTESSVATTMGTNDSMTQSGKLVQTTTGTPTDGQTGAFGPGPGIIGAVVAVFAIAGIGLLTHRQS